MTNNYNTTNEKKTNLNKMVLAFNVCFLFRSASK